MTETLRKIIEAMRVEFERQVEDEGANFFARARANDLIKDDPLDCIDGNFDMEKVARAALVAVSKDINNNVTRAMHTAVERQYDLHKVYASMLDAAMFEILK